LFIIGVGSFGPSRNPRKGPRSIGSGPAENQHAEVEIRAPREARLDAQPQMTHGVVAQGHGDEEVRAGSCSRARRRGPASLSRSRLSRSSRNINFFGDHDGGALVPRHDDFLPERRRKPVHLGVVRTVQWIMCTRADCHCALWKESPRGIVA